MMCNIKLGKLKHNYRQCCRCWWVWRIRIKDSKCCPHCKSYKWNSPIKDEAVCKKCKWSWTPKKDNPLACPHCKSYNWK